ncbi:MAG: DUF445 family protein [Desulfobulbaceae bacterium]|nr:DUF445 family protein [Desulfobulbaceae bacterium]HIJ78114.1 DUF445 family protein [Deltaproteobacteria bacterium]
MNALTYLAPPLVGAFIGYTTNYIAIRMLFRPLKPWRFLGIRVPMTPGVIPAKRHELAENIGEMVGEHLLTSEDVSRAFTEERFHNELLLLIESRVETFLSRDLGPVASLVPNRFRSYFDVGIKILRWRFLKHLHNHLDSSQLTDSLAATIKTHLDEFLARQASSCFSPQSREHLANTVRETFERFLTSPAVQNWVREFFSRQIDDFLAKDGCLQDLLPATISDPLLKKLEAQTPELLKKFAKMLEEPEMQDRIAAAITGAIQNLIKSLGPLAAMIGNVISPELIDQKIRGYLADKGDEIGRLLLNDQVQQRVAGVLRDKAQQLMTTPVNRLLADVEPAQIEQARSWLADLAIAVLANPGTAASISNLIDQGLASQEQRPVKEILADLFGSQGLDKATSWTTDEIISVIRSRQTKRILDNLVVELVEQKLLSNPIGPLATFLPKEVQYGISDYLLQQISALLIREVPDLIDALNIRHLVARKVDSLDLLRLEGLLLGIMQEQFKYINLFGGLLGFIIGLANLLFFIGR